MKPNKKEILLDVNCFQLKNARSIEDVLCMATLFANGEIKSTNEFRATISDAREWVMINIGDDCNICPHVNKCLACDING